MAVYPCSVGDHRYAGAARNFYATWLAGPDEDRRRLRLCESHWLAIEPYLMQYQIADDGITAGDALAPSRCGTCLEPLFEGGVQIFVTCYPAKDERKDYWFQIHYKCGVPSWFPTKF
jgi:hypothetical protein